MAVALNKTRVRDSWLVALLCTFLFAISHSMADDTSLSHESLDFLGYVLIVICALGRVYTTAFLGGHKNKMLITYGPFSVVRNPLYLFSFLGVLGISLASMRLSIMLIAPFSIGLIYYFLVRREERFLLQTFGEEYRRYMASTPRFIPNFMKYQAPEQVVMNPSRLLSSALDALWWFLPLPVFELLETFHF